jgi:hypothetical protein
MRLVLRPRPIKAVGAEPGGSRADGMLRTQVPVRKLNLHEAQSANIMRDHGVNTPKGGVATTPEEAEKVPILPFLGASRACCIAREKYAFRLQRNTRLEDRQILVQNPEKNALE